MKSQVFVIFLTLAVVSFAQRPTYAGRLPIGYPVLETTTLNSGLGNRFGEDDISATTMRLPLEARGDAELVARLSKLPKENQPFWLLNWLALEENRRNPQTYEQRPNSFVSKNS